MAGEHLFLKGVFTRRLKQIGVVIGGLTTLGGIGTYVASEMRNDIANKFVKSCTPEELIKTDNRVMRSAGFDRKDYQRIPFLKDKEGEFDELKGKFCHVQNWLVVERKVLEEFDPEMKNYFPPLFYSGFREDWVESQEEKEKFQQQLFNCRKKCAAALIEELAAGNLIKGHEDIDIFSENKEDIEKLVDLGVLKGTLMYIYFLELWKQSVDGLQEQAVPLAVRYIPAEAKAE